MAKAGDGGPRTWRIVSSDGSQDAFYAEACSMVEAATIAAENGITAILIEQESHNALLRHKEPTDG